MTLKNVLLVLLGCWVIGFVLGLTVAQYKSPDIDTEEKANAYFKENVRYNAVENLLILNHCGKVYYYDPVTSKQGDKPDTSGKNKKSSFAFTAASAVGMLGTLKLLGFEVTTAKEVLAAAGKNPWYKALGVVGGGIGLGVGYYLGEKNICDCKNEALADFIKKPDYWHAYLSIAKVSQGVTTLPSKIIIGSVPYPMSKLRIDTNTKPAIVKGY